MVACNGATPVPLKVIGVVNVPPAPTSDTRTFCGVAAPVVSGAKVKVPTRLCDVLLVTATVCPPPPNGLFGMPNDSVVPAPPLIVAVSDILAAASPTRTLPKLSEDELTPPPVGAACVSCTSTRRSASNEVADASIALKLQPYPSPPV